MIWQRVISNKPKIETIIALLQNVKHKGFFHLLSANVFIQIAGFASQFLVAWILPPSDIGRIKILQTYSNLAGIVAGLGFNTSVLKLCSETRSLGEKVFLFEQSVKYTAVASLFTLSLFLAASYSRMFTDDSTLVIYFCFYSLIVVTIAFTSLQNAYLQALKKIQLLSGIQAYTKTLTVFLIILFTYLFGLSGYIAAIIGGSYISVAVLYMVIKRRNAATPAEPVEKPFSTHWFYAKYSFLSNVVYQVFLVIDILLLNAMISDKNLIGFYSFALTLMIPFEVLRGTIVQIVTPYFSEKATDIAELSRVLNKYAVILKVLSVAVLVAAILVIPVAIKTLFSGKYDGSVIFFEILLFAWVTRCYYSMKSIALWGLGRVDLSFFSVLIVLPFAFVISFFCIRVLGAKGAALGNIVAELLMFGVTAFFFKKQMVTFHEKMENRV